MRRTIVIAVIAGFILVGVAGAAGYFVGQSTRLSDAEVALAVDDGVDEAVSATTEEQEAIRRKALAESRRVQRREMKKQLAKVRRKLTEKAEQQAAQSFASGQSTGYENGRSDGEVEGFEEGLTEGSDDLTCSDDSDIYWLPACDF